MIIKLPWPDSVLSPNARAHWRPVAKAKKAAKAVAYYLAKEAGQIAPTEAPNVAMMFCPPDKRRRDLDNLIASLKGHLDGISDAIGIDDSKFRLAAHMGPVIDGGAVFVTVTP